MSGRYLKSPAMRVRAFGTTGLLMQALGFAFFLAVFTLTWLHLIVKPYSGVPFLIFKCAIGLILLSLIPGLIVTFVDKSRSSASWTLALIFPPLAVMGILDGHF